MKRVDWRTAAMIVVSFLVVPMLTQWAFRTKAPIPFLVAEWTAGEFLGYAGSIIGAVATIAAVTMTITLERDERYDDQRLNVLPLIAITPLERYIHRQATPAGGAQASDSHEERSSEDAYIVVGESGEISYTSKLTEDQDRLAHGGSFVSEKMDGPLSFSAQNKTFYYPLALSSAGNGPAINVTIRMEKGGIGPKHDGTGEYRHLPTVQLTVGENVRVGILFEDRLAPAAMGQYDLVVSYYDTLGNLYQQRHELALLPSEGAGSSVTFGFDLKINQERLTK